MAEVTVNSRRTNVAGGRKHKTYNVTGATGNTLTTRLRKIDFVGYDTALITAVSISGGTVTFTSSAPFTADILAIGT